MNDRHKSLKEIIIKYLSLDSLLEEQSDEIIKKLNDIYSDGRYRHRYSEITEAVLSSIKKDEDATLMTITQNIRIIKEKIDNQKENTNTKANIEKLYDHINLECIRLRESNQRMKKINEDLSRLEKFNDKIENKLKSTEQILKKQQAQYITILGIFASIVLAFVGGLTFSTSVLANMHNVSFFRLVFVLCFIALFFGNILHFLFRFLKDINQVQKSKFWQQGIFYFNVFMIFILIVSYYKCLLK